MLELLSGFDWLGEQFPTTTQRFAVSFAVLGVFVYVLLTYRRLQDRLLERVRPLYVDVATVGLLVTTGVLTAAVIVGVWEQTSEVQALYTDIDLGGTELARAVLSIVFVLSALIVTRLVRRVIHELFESSPAVTEHQREVTYRLAQVSLWTVTFVVVLGLWIEDLSSLLVGAGLIGAAIGMAARQTIGSVIAGFVLMFARPFEIGDWIEVDGEEGVVTDISIFNTRLRTFDGESLIVPNDHVSSSLVTNRSRRGRLRIEVDVNIDYRTDIDRAAAVIEEAVSGLEPIADVPEPTVVTREFGDSAVVLGAWFWIDDPTARRYWRARTAAVGAIKNALEEEGIKIPFPQRELSGRAETGGFRIAGENESRSVRYDSDGETEGESDGSDATDDSDASADGEVAAPEDR